MKLLKGQTTTVERDGIKIEVKVIDTTMQANIYGLSVERFGQNEIRGLGIDGRMKLAGYMLRNCIDTIEIDGVPYDPIVIAARADVSDKSTREKMYAIIDMVTGAALSSQEEEKK